MQSSHAFYAFRIVIVKQSYFHHDLDLANQSRYTQWDMPLPDLIKHSAEKKLSAFCDRRIPPHIRNQLRLLFKFRDNSVTLFETRPAFKAPSVWTELPIAQFRFNLDEKLWRLYHPNRKKGWRQYDRIKPSNLDDLLAELEGDPTRIFWG